ncbi:MAG: coproporphyrinogen dehydrogenase HemZ [Clostridia bacterium]|nr:coproporphyrinogen dehydrogenase HemZ [Clostridia bacterium]
MKLIINGNDYHYEFEQLIRVFMPDVKLEKIFDSPCVEGDFVLCESVQSEHDISLRVICSISEFSCKKSEVYVGDNLYKQGELIACKILYSMLCAYSGYRPEWGMQTGVRPTKIFFNLLRNNTEAQAVKYLEEDLFISKSKVNLITEVCKNEKAVMDSSRTNQFSLYVSVPFCPTRCSYCSFISHSFDSIKKLIPEYVRLLCEEIAQIAALTKELHLYLRTVYIGGGTPTVLDTKQLLSICEEIQRDFDLSQLSEVTLEAGRPDTLSEEKLNAIKNSFVTRITINAQTFNDEILASIGRKHTADDMYLAYACARKAGFDNINTDLIAGLEGESTQSFLHSVQSAIDLSAENITVHTLALKRSSFLITRDEAKGKIEAATSNMITKANSLLKENGYIPYYMYRQSKSVGNLENTGWSKPGHICEYNIFMMEEVHHVFGAGAGAVTRLVDTDTRSIRRIYNYKYPYEYIDGFAEMIKRKKDAADVIKKWQKP